MKDKKQTTESFQATYRTGSTRPPKSRGGIIAFLLVLVIFLSGISTGLGLMNIRLFQKLNAMKETEPGPVVFSQGSASELPESVVEYPLGFAGQEVSAFWQTYYNLPAGIYVVEVTDARELLPGDILTQMEGVALSSIEDFQSVLQTLTPGQSVEAVLYRAGKDITATLTMKVTAKED